MPLSADNVISDASLRGIALDLEKREIDLLKRESEFDLKQREAKIKHQQRDDAFELKRLGVELEQKKRESEIEDQRRGLDFQKRDLDIQKRDLDAQKRDLDAQKQQLDAQKHQLETQKQIFELHQKDHQTQFESMLEQHHFAPFLHVDHGLVSSDNMPSLGSAPSSPFVPGGSGSGRSKGTPCSKSSTCTCKQSGGERFPTSAEDGLDAKLSEIQRGKRQLKSLSEAVMRGFDDLVRQQRHLARESEEREATLIRDFDIKTNQVKQDAKESIAKAKQESHGSLVKSQNESKQLLRGLNNLMGCKLVVGQVKGWHSISNFELARALKIIQDCNKNSKHYGASAHTEVQIEYRCEQLSKQIHVDAVHYFDPLKFIFDTGDKKHINPHDPKVTWNAYTILSYYWKSDTDSGKAPKLTPDLKVFFCSPCISNGDWVQFHGPGTILYQIDPGFKLTVGSLCDPDGEGSFTSIHCKDPGIPPDTNGTTYTSPYQIKFKWK